jgi:hyperosmotically inducible protein
MNTTHLHKTLLAASIAAGLGLAVAACDPASPPTSQSQALAEGGSAAISDTAITAQVQAGLATDRDLQAANINVTTSNGVVTLMGSVSDMSARSAAERSAMSIAGVRSVSNDLTTSSGGVASSGSLGGAIDGAQEAVSDTWITSKVKSELLADSVSQGFEVSVETHDGVVALEGTLPDQDALDHVLALARSVDGVQRVDGSALLMAERG